MSIDVSFVRNLPPSLLGILPSAPPPPGVVPDFENPQTLVPVILAVESVFTAIALIVFFIRIYTKSVILRSWKWDDFMIGLGLICTLIIFIVTIYGCMDGAIGRHGWEVTIKQRLGDGHYYHSYIAFILTSPGGGLIKLGLFIQYYLLFSVRKYVRVSVYIGGTASTLFYIAISITAFVLCSPWPGEDRLDTLTSAHYSEFWKFMIPIGVIGLVVDLVLFLIPIPAIMALQTSKAKRFGFLLIFMTGGLAVAASATNAYYRVDLQRDMSDPTWKFTYIVIWAHIEMCCGITASSMPSVRHFFIHYKLLSKGSNMMSSHTRTLSRIRHRFRRPGQEELLGGSNGFKQWGYNHTTTVDVENTLATSQETQTTLQMTDSYAKSIEPPVSWKSEEAHKK